MKVLIASDIHGSAYWCRKMLEVFDKSECQKLVLLGDILYHGPRNSLPREYSPDKTARMLNERKGKILVVRGNCDSEVDQMMVEFPILGEYALLYVDGLTIFATHGHKYNKENLPNISKGDVLLCGHTHVPMIEKFSDFTYVNPGSVSIPKEKSPNSCMILENKEFSFVNL